MWQRLSGDGADDAERYEDIRHDDAVALLAFPPRFALDIGCNAGGVALSVRDAYPECRLWGVEPNPRAAALARSRMERVIVSAFDAIDWSAEGIGVGDVDTVFLLDVLEHMYNPWQALQCLRELVGPEAQAVISLPNVRNAFVIRDLMNGYWRYRDSGLLDATHIRFFSHYDALRLIYQTGFRVERHRFAIDVGMARMCEEMTAQGFPQRLEFEKGALVIEDSGELHSFMAMQHLFLVRPAQRDALSAEERKLAAGPYPETFARGSDRPGTL